MENLPKVKYQDTLTIFGVELKCAVLDDGRRVFDTESIEKLFDAMSDPNTHEESPDSDAMKEFCKFIKGIK